MTRSEICSKALSTLHKLNPDISMYDTDEFNINHVGSLLPKYEKQYDAILEELLKCETHNIPNVSTKTKMKQVINQPVIKPTVKIVKVGRQNKYWTAKQLANLEPNQRENLDTDRPKQYGINAIWSSIPVDARFTVCFLTKPEPITKKARKEFIETSANELGEVIEESKTRELKEKAGAYLTEILDNQHKELTSQRERVLNGYKIYEQSNTGSYLCVDTDIEEHRYVNINTIQWLEYKGVKYIVE